MIKFLKYYNQQQQSDLGFQQNQFISGKQPYFISSPYQGSSSSLNQQSSFNLQNISPIRNKQVAFDQNSYLQKQNQMNQGGLQYNQRGYQQFQQPGLYNASPQTQTNYYSPTQNDYVLFERKDPNQRFENTRIFSSQQNLGYQNINAYPLATLHTNKTSNNQLLTESNRANRYQDISNTNSAYYSRQTEQDRSIYSYQLNKPQDRQFLSPDQVSVKSGRRKIFSPISDRTIGSIENEVNSFSKLRQSGVSNRMTSSRQGSSYGSQYGIQQSGQFGTQSLGYQNQNFQFGLQNRQQQLYGSQLQRSIYSPDKKKIFSPVMDYSKNSPLTKDTLKIEEEDYDKKYESNLNRYQSQAYNQMRSNTEGNYRPTQNRQNEDEGLYSPKFQDNEDEFYRQDVIAEKFYDPDNDKESSSYQSFNHQNISTDVQSLEQERTSPEKNSALRYLQEERIKRQLEGESQKQQENKMDSRKKIFFNGIGVLIILILLVKITQLITSNFSG